VCILLQFLKVLPRSLHKEGGGGEWFDEHVEEVKKHVYQKRRRTKRKSSELLRRNLI
jgi:hypothetical protein